MQLIHPQPAEPEGSPLPDDPRVVVSLSAALLSAIPTARDAHEAERLVLAVVERHFAARSSFVAWSHPPTGELKISSARGREDPRVCSVALGEAEAGRAAANATVERGNGVVAVGVAAAGRKGCLALVDPRDDVPDPWLGILAAALGAAVEAGRVRDELARHAKDLETAVNGLRALESSRESLWSRVSHDLKTPLTTIKTHLSILSQGREGPLEPGQREALSVCDRNADRLLRMINDLIMLSRLQAGEMTLSDRPFGLKAVAEEVAAGAASLARLCGVTLEVSCSREVFVRGDRGRIAEALWAFVEGALLESAPGATITLAVTGDSATATCTLRFQARDSVPASPDRIGSRLGVELATKIVRLHGGVVSFPSSPSGFGGTEVTLPTFAGLVAANEPEAAAPRPGGILLVEDDRDCREVLQDVLEGEGFRVFACGTVSEAMRLLESTCPGLVLLDLKLPDGSGETVLEHVRASSALANTPVWVISGASDLGALPRGKGWRQLDGVLEKPVHLPRLLDLVARTVSPAKPAELAE